MLYNTEHKLGLNLLNLLKSSFDGGCATSNAKSSNNAAKHLRAEARSVRMCEIRQK